MLLAAFAIKAASSTRYSLADTITDTKSERTTCQKGNQNIRHFTQATSQREEQHYADNNCARQHSDYDALMVG